MSILGQFLTKKGAKNGQKMKILKKPSEWAVICPLVTFCTHKKAAAAYINPGVMFTDRHQR